MHSCEDTQKIIGRYIVGEIKPSDLEVLNQHLPTCMDCQALMEMHEELQKLEVDTDFPADEAFHSMRSRVFAQISSGTGEQTPRSHIKFADAIPALAAAAMLVLGVFIGTLISKPATLNDELILDAISQQASLDRSLEDAWEAPLFFSNVNLRDWNDQRVSLNLDVCRNVDLGTGLNSALASDILSQAILNSDSSGRRMRAMEVASLSSETRLTRALVLALQQDPDQTMRIAALNALSGQGGSEQVQAALMQALRDDPSVQVRLLALEQLAGQSIELDRLESVIRQGDARTNPALFERVRELNTNSTSEDWL